jgi:hypothetical protein
MSYVIAEPELMTSAATDLATIGSNVSAAHMVAAARTMSVIPAAADEVSASIAQLFSQHAADYQALAGKAAAFQEQFVQHLTASAGAYASAEGFFASLLRISALLYNFSLNAGPFGLLLHDLTLGPLLQSLLGGIGAPGPLPTIAAQIFNSEGTVRNALAQILGVSQNGDYTSSPNAMLFYYLANALPVLELPINVLLFPWLLIYLLETAVYVPF